MRFPFVFGFILIIILIIGVFVGLPYVAQLSKSGFFSLPFFPTLRSGPRPMQGVGAFPQNATSTINSVIKIGESLYKGRVTINFGFFSTKSISLRASYFSGAIDITGWKIKSAQRGETVISRGINLPQFETVPSDIWLASGDSVDIILGVSPLGGNFRANNCFGWLNNLYNFDYSLDYCPGGFKFSDLAGLDSSCQDLILHSNNCRTLSDSSLNQESGQCRQWAEKNMNYNACVIGHRNDGGFYKEWKVYTGNGNQFFDPTHDRIELRDQAGLLVDSYEY